MKKIGVVLFSSLILIFSFSCETTNPFGGPVYDTEGNLKIDSLKIVEYLLTTPYDSLYRIHDPSGVVVIVQEEGVGSRPRNNNVIYTNYVGKLLDGTVFDTNLEDVAKENDLFVESASYNVFQFPLGSTNAIQGFSIGFQRMRSGSKGVIIIPSPFAYRNEANREKIPPNSVLVFEVDFLGMD